MITIALILVGLISFGLMLLGTRAFNGRVHNFEDLESKLQILDLQAFLNLTDPGETEFLRTRLKPGQFRTVQRARIRATMEYLRAIARNAKALLAMGELARRSSDEHIADAGQELVDTAMRTRLLVLAVYARLIPTWMFPSAADGHLDKVAAGYEQLKDQLLYLVSIQQPNLTSRAATLL